MTIEKKIASEDYVNEEITKLSEEKVDYSQLESAVNTALQNAKDSGEFDGTDGTNYILTEDDKTDIAKQVPIVKVAQQPTAVKSIAEMTETSKLYVMNGYIYQYKEVITTTEGSSKPNFTNMVTHKSTIINKNKRYSKSSQAYSTESGCDAIVIPIPTTSPVTIRLRGCTQNKTRRSVYGGTSNSAFNYSIWDTDFSVDANGDQYLTFKNTAGGIGAICSWLVMHVNTIDTSSAIITVNEEITYTVTEGGTVTTVEWSNTGNAFVPADYEGRIIDLENKTAILKNQIGSNSTLGISQVYAPSPQLPADGSTTSDFNASDMDCNDIYSYIDVLVSKYPRYITKEILGKDASGTYDWNRYVCSRRTYDAWQKVNYPPMYAWVNGSTTIYSVSVSPRTGDTLYTTKYIGTAKGTVSAVSNANQTRTVGGVVYTRDESKDIEPTLVYTETAYSPYYVGVYAGHKNGVYNSSKTKIGTISTYTGATMKDSNSVSYVRYPLGDRNENFETIPAIVIGANEHGGNINGDPREPAIVTSRLIKDLCECSNANNPFINLLKNDYMLVFCPIINPYGFTNEVYENSNGINIDRNFDTVGWGNDTSSGTAQGSYGGSENETQYFMNTLVASKCKIALANHALGSHLNTTTGESVNAGHCHYMLGRNNSKYDKYLNAIGSTMSANYNLSFTDYGQAPPESNAKTRSYIASIGAEGGAVEMNAREGFVKAGQGQLHTARILEADYALMLQFLHMLIEAN